jgi:hypothetical protein
MGFSESLEVGKVLRAAGGPLVGHEIVTTEERHGTAGHGFLAAPGPRRREVRQPADRGEQVDADRGNPELDDDVAACEVLRTAIACAPTTRKRTCASSSVSSSSVQSSVIGRAPL